MSGFQAIGEGKVLGMLAFVSRHTHTGDWSARVPELGMAGPFIAKSPAALREVLEAFILDRNPRVNREYANTVWPFGDDQ